MYLDALTERYVQSALLAREVGFDGVDIKSCHRYLLSELLAHTPGENTAEALRTAPVFCARPSGLCAKLW